MNKLFSGCENLTRMDWDNSTFITSKVSSMVSMFRNCRNLTKLDVNFFSTSKITDMTNMFANCSGLKELYVNEFDISQVTIMNSKEKMKFMNLIKIKNL